MVGATLAVFVVFAMLALSRKSPGAALGIVVLSMMVWPEFLRIPVGLAEMSVPRLVALALLGQMIARGRHRAITFGTVDKLVLAIWLWIIFAAICAGSAFPHVSQMIGRGFDTVLMYFIARVTLLSAEDVRGFYLGLAASAVAMCAAGVYEAVTSKSPYQALRGFQGWRFGAYKDTEYRYGLLRAQGSMSVSIYFGMAMMLVLGMLCAVRGYLKDARLYKLVWIAALLAALSSMSSGPWLACFMLLGLYVYEKRPGLIKPSLWLALIAAVVLEVASNRHFYNLIDYFALDKHTAWYRTRLMEVAVSRLHEFWLFGVGSNWPHHWGEIVDGRGHIDVVNNFLIIALYGGLPAWAMFLATHVSAIRQTVRAWQADRDSRRRQLLFGFAATLVALDFSSMSVGLFGPPLLLSHILLGVMVSAAVDWVPERSTERAVDDPQPDGAEDWTVSDGLAGEGRYD